MASKEIKIEKMRSSKQAATMKSRGISGHIVTHHQRLRHALSLGTRVDDGKESKWQCTDIEIQRHVVRSIASFLDCISGDYVHHPLVKDSIGDMVGALAWILQNKSNAVLSMAASLIVKLINIIPNVLLQPYLLDLIHPLSSLLSSHQVQVSISCANALTMILSDLGVKKETEVWDILTETGTVSCIISDIKEISHGALSIEYFQEMASLLSTILCRWPPSRYPVWNDDKFLEVLEVIHERSDFYCKVSVLKLYAALALCGNGATKLLENGGGLLHMMVICMGRSHPIFVRTEGFRLAQCLVKSEQGCLKMMSLCCEPIVNAVIDGMSGWTSNSGKIANDEMSLLVEACHLALMINCWAGEHHDCFWKRGIDWVLLSLLLGFQIGPSQHSLSLEEHIAIAKKGLKSNFLPRLRPYVWDLLGWLAAHFMEDFNSSIFEHGLEIDILITCACISFGDLIQQRRQICLYEVVDNLGSESASRAVLMMIYSPCKYIASRAKAILDEILKPHDEGCVKYLLYALNIRPSKDNLGMPDILRTSINLVAVLCYSGLPQYQSHIVKHGGTKTLLNLIWWCLSNDIHIERASLSPHLHNRFSERICCWVSNEDWEGSDVLLLYGLWGLAELIHSGSVENIAEIFAGQVDYTESQFISKLQDICSDTTSAGIKWYAAFILSYFGLYGFPCKLGRRIGKALHANNYTDVQLILSNEDSVSVHGVVLAVRCPSLLPPEELPDEKKALDGSSLGYDIRRKAGMIQKKIHLSSHVDSQALAKLLEFVYWGYLNAGEELVKKVKILAKRCNLQPLLMMLGRRHPKWGTHFPKYDLSPALAPTRHCFSYGLLLDFSYEDILIFCPAFLLFSSFVFVVVLMPLGIVVLSSKTCTVKRTFLDLFTKLTSILLATGNRDVILEAKATKSICWTCSMCSQLVPHIHVHRVVLWSACDYLRALFQSGMVESNSQTIKVPISLEAMRKLVSWCYTDELPRPPSGCLWDNMGTEERVSVLQPYVELCWLAEFWFLEDVQDISYRIIESYLDAARHLSSRIIKIASDFSLWKLIEVAANYLAPLYRQLCHTGDLEGLDEAVIDMIRAASVRLSQEK